MSRNYYIILGVPSNATQTDIKAAYRKLAKELHPDYYGEEQAPFQVLQEAYSVLSNPESRTSYDNSLQDDASKQHYQHTTPARRYSADTVEPLSPGGREGFQHHWSGFDRMYEQFPDSFRRQRQPENRQFNKLTLEITLSPSQAQSGGDIRLKIPVQIRCPSCSGNGNLRYYSCWHCSGAGFLWREKPVLIRYPAGIIENQTMQFSLSPYNGETIYLTALFKVQ